MKNNKIYFMFEDASGDTPTFYQFVAQIIEEGAVGLWVEGHFAYKIQFSSWGYVPDTFNAASYATYNQFSGFFIHNYLGGDAIYRVPKYTKVALIWPDTIEWFIIGGTVRYKGSPNGKCRHKLPYYELGVSGPVGGPLRTEKILLRHYQRPLTIQTSVCNGEFDGLHILVGPWTTNDRYEVVIPADKYVLPEKPIRENTPGIPLYGVSVAEAFSCIIPGDAWVDWYGSPRDHGEHKGWDYVVETETAWEVYSPVSGVVTFSDYIYPYGNLVVENQGFQILIAHNSSNLVYVGDRISAGDILSISGDTGLSYGPHVHFEVRKCDINSGNCQVVAPRNINFPGQEDVCYWDLKTVKTVSRFGRTYSCGWNINVKTNNFSN
jgi:hypothetical protein